jgi:hypothetical protein
MMKKYEKQNQKLMATWAADCVERVFPFFEKAYPNDDRPCEAIETCRTWVRTGVLKMAEIRGASLAALAAARAAKENEAACYAARAAGQAWLLRTSHNMPSEVPTTLLKRSRRLTLPMPRQKPPKNIIGRPAIFQQS